MKTNTFLFTVLFASSVICYAQGPDIDWQQSIGGDDDDFGWFVEISQDGGYIAAGHSYSSNGDLTENKGGRDFWIVKLNASGNIVWQKSLGGTGNESARCIQPTTDGGYVVAGANSSVDGDITGNKGGIDFWIVKLNASGSILWQKSFGGSKEDVATSIQQTTDNGYIVTGYSKSGDGDVNGHHGEGSGDIWVLKLDASGDIIWQNTLGGTGIDYSYSIQETDDNGYILIGASNSNDGDVSVNHGDFDVWVVKLNVIGSIVWQKSYGGSNEDWGYSIRKVSDGGFIIGAYSFSNDGDVSGNHGESDIWVAKLDNLGVILWEKSLGGSSNEYTWSVQSNENNGFIVAGYSMSNDGDVSENLGDFDYWIVELDHAGNIEWQKSYGGSAEEKSRAIKQTSDGAYIIAGYSFSNDGDVSGSNGDRDLWIVKLVASQETGITTTQTLTFNVYPNPSSESVTLSNVPDDALIQISDASGKVIYKNRSNGVNQVINLSNIANGVYLVHIKKDDLVGQTKLIMIN